MRKNDAVRLLARALRDEGVSPGVEEALKLSTDLFGRMPEIEWDPHIPKHAQELKELGAQIERDRLRPIVDEAFDEQDEEKRMRARVRLREETRHERREDRLEGMK